MDYLILLFAVILGAAIAYFFKNNSKFNKRLLMFSAGLLLAITILDLFPSLYINGGSGVGIWIISGVGLQLFLEGLSKGIEHGHVHHNHKHNRTIIPISVMLGLFIHSFLEGMPIEAQNILHDHGHHHGHHEHSNLLWALSVHKVSESIVLATFLFSMNLKKLYTWGILALFAISAPTGAFLGSFMNVNTYPIVLGIVAGIFLHISSVIIFESNEKHSLNWQKMLYVFLGMLIGYFITNVA